MPNTPKLHFLGSHDTNKNDEPVPLRIELRYWNQSSPKNAPILVDCQFHFGSVGRFCKGTGTSETLLEVLEHNWVWHISAVPLSVQI